jgi:stage V sporulation protein G
VEITEIRVKLMSDRLEKLQAFCSVTFNDDFVVRDLKIIGGAKGPFVAMPSRKLMDRCQKCGGKNHLRARYCNECGVKLNPNRAEKDNRGRARLHTDIAHPINSSFREIIQARILQAFEEERIMAKEPDYVAPSLHDNDYIEEFSVDQDEEAGSPDRSKWRDGSRRESNKKQEESDSFDAGIFN